MLNILNKNNKIIINKDSNKNKYILSTYKLNFKTNKEIKHFSLFSIHNLSNNDIKQLNFFIDSTILLIKKQNNYLIQNEFYFVFFLRRLSLFIVELYESKFLTPLEVPIKYINYILSDPRIKNLKLDFIFINNLNLGNKNNNI
jgi:hypothetical protein